MSNRRGGHVSHNFSEIVLKCGLWNIRTCSSDGEKFNGIFSELSSRNYRLTVLTETWQENGQIELSSQYTIYNSGFVIDGDFTGGVAFLVDTSVFQVEAFNPYSERLASIELKFGDFFLCIVGCCAPTETSSYSEIEKFYLDLDYLVRQIDSRQFKTVLIMGDFNCRIGHDSHVYHSSVVGPFADCEDTTENGRCVVDFCENNRLFVVNSFFQKRKNHHFTCYDKNGRGVVTDLVLAPKRSELYVTDARASRSVTTSSDHVLLTVILRHSFKRRMTPRKGKSKLEVRRSVPVEIQPLVSSTPIVISEPILPKRTNRQKNKPWFVEVKEKLVPELLEKHRLRKQWLLDQLPESFEAFKKQRNRVANQIRCAKMQYEKKKMEGEQEKSIEFP